MELDGRSLQVHEQFVVRSLPFENAASSEITFPQDRNPRADCEPLAIEKHSAAAHRPICVFFQSRRSLACSAAASPIRNGTGAGAGTLGLQLGAVGWVPA